MPGAAAAHAIAARLQAASDSSPAPRPVAFSAPPGIPLGVRPNPTAPQLLPPPWRTRPPDTCHIESAAAGGPNWTHWGPPAPFAAAPLPEGMLTTPMVPLALGAPRPILALAAATSFGTPALGPLFLCFWWPVAVWARGTGCDYVLLGPLASPSGLGQQPVVQRPLLLRVGNSEPLQNCGPVHGRLQALEGRRVLYLKGHKGLMALRLPDPVA